MQVLFEEVVKKGLFKDVSGFCLLYLFVSVPAFVQSSSSSDDMMLTCG